MLRILLISLALAFAAPAAGTSGWSAPLRVSRSRNSGTAAC